MPTQRIAECHLSQAHDIEGIPILLEFISVQMNWISKLKAMYPCSQTTNEGKFYNTWHISAINERLGIWMDGWVGDDWTKDWWNPPPLVGFCMHWQIDRSSICISRLVEAGSNAGWTARDYYRRGCLSLLRATAAQHAGQDWLHRGGNSQKGPSTVSLSLLSGHRCNRIVYTYTVIHCSLRIPA